jgi:N6-adenosine-specific RNA methylase IME4
LDSSIVVVPPAPPPVTPPLPFGQKFSVIVADPAWKFGNTKSRGAAEDHYRTMANSEIVFLPVHQIVADDAFLFMWVTDVHLLGTNIGYSPALEAIRRWGFEPKLTMPWIKTKADVREFTADDLGHVAPMGEDTTTQYVEIDSVIGNVKVQIGMGNYFRHSHELCIFATRGKAKSLVHNLPSVIFAARGQHSRKPDAPLIWAEKMMGHGPYLEMFARRDRPEWTSWGSEAPEVVPDHVDEDEIQFLERVG